MERLTYRDSDGTAWATMSQQGGKVTEVKGRGADKLADYEDTGLTPEEISNLETVNGNLVRANESLNHKLSTYRQAEEQGLLHKAPVPDGTSIFRFSYVDLFDEALEASEDSYLHGYTETVIGEINKDWFLTREAAEEALQKGAGE